MLLSRFKEIVWHVKRRNSIEAHAPCLTYLYRVDEVRVRFGLVFDFWWLMIVVPLRIPRRPVSDPRETHIHTERAGNSDRTFSWGGNSSNCPDDFSSDDQVKCEARPAAHVNLGVWCMGKKRVVRINFATVEFGCSDAMQKFING